MSVDAPLQVGQRRPDQASFRELFEAHAPFVWRCLRRMGVSEADVEDVCQEVFVVVLRKLDQFDGRAAIRSWLYGISVRKASDYRRRAHRKRETSAEAAHEPAVEPSQGDAVERRAARDMLDEILGQLDDKHRAVFVLYEIEQLTMPEIVEALGCPLQTAYSRLRAARQKVQAAAERMRARRLVS